MNDVTINYYELSGMHYVGFHYTHDADLPVTKILKNLRKIIKAHSEYENYIIQSVTTRSASFDENEFWTTIILAG